MEVVHLSHQVVLYLAYGQVGLLLGGHEEIGGVELVFGKASLVLQRDGVELLDAVYLIVPEGDAQHHLVVGHVDVDGVALHTEVATLQGEVVAGVERGHELAQQHVAVDVLSLMQLDDVLLECHGRPHAVDARHRAHHHHVSPAREQRRDGAQTHAVYLLVDGQVFLYVGVGVGQVGLGLIVVVVAHVVLHGVLWEEALHLFVELCCQCLVVREDERGACYVLYDVGHGKRLARPGDAEQHLCAVAAQHAVGELSDGLWLVACGLVW